MPIHPENKSRYPANWTEIASRIKFERAGGRCECDGRCGDPLCHGLKHGRCNAEHGEPHPVNGKKTIMTCAHINHKPEECGDDDLAGWCARCHIFYDREHHANERKKRKARRHRRIAEKAAAIRFQLECGIQ